MFREASDKDYDVLVAENRFINEVQFQIENALERRDMSQADLARALGVSEARVSQILADSGKNLQARTIARIAHILGFDATIKFSFLGPPQKREVAPSEVAAGATFDAWIRSIRSLQGANWEMPCNDDEVLEAA